MVDLVSVCTSSSQITPGAWIEMALYCWACKTVHQFPLDDVEKLVYALGAAEQDAYRVGTEDPELAEVLAGDLPCLLTVRRDADDIEMYREHVEQGVGCRVEADL